ncbi:DUF3995 domain-containing protein [Rugosimonospora africana]|uniref:DUF3995 domain-containing protein n=1 Tax=Rugosimonospora africana TaxID=556532 RepID=UPI0019408181|nr:DUF3995 domain-containing protein [Rugosimonospora africana]
MTASAVPRRHLSPLITVCLLAAAWGLVYSVYRGYYGFGGTVGMIGTVKSTAEWRTLNLTAAAVLMVAAVLPLLAPLASRRARLRPVLLVVCWILAVGCVMHGLIDDMQRVLSLTVVRPVSYPASLWATVDTRAADIQDLAFNETWFLIEGLLWGALGWVVLGPSGTRRRWVGSALAGVAALTAIGMLSAFGVIGRFVIG